MSRILDVSLHAITIVLLLNAVCIFYSAVDPYATREPTKTRTDCNCTCSSHYLKHHHIMKPHTNPSFLPIQDFIPPGFSTLDPSYSKYSLTRIGSELSFSYKSCPAQSVMVSDWTKIEPIHKTCPAVFIIGARKGGTTSLYQYLSNHPDFEGYHLEEGPKAGETFHFSNRYSTESWDLYKSRFTKQHFMTGDASVGNFVDCEVPKRIFESCGNFSKIVIILRNPINRYTSNFLMRARLGTRANNNTGISTVTKLEMQSYVDTLLAKGIDINAAMSKGPKLWSKFLCMYKPSRNMIYEGFYYVHLMNWLCNYPSENIIILNSEEFYRNTSEILKQVYQFLGLQPLSNDHRNLITSFVFNKGSQTVLSHQILQKSDRKKLNALYKSFNKELMKLLTWDVDWK